MDGMDVVMLLWSVMLTIVGLFMVVMQKKGLFKAIKPHVETSYFLGIKQRRVHGMWGGVFVFTGTFAGFVVLRKYSVLWAFLYAGAVAGIYILIQIIYHKKKEK